MIFRMEYFYFVSFNSFINTFYFFPFELRLLVKCQLFVVVDFDTAVLF